MRKLASFAVIALCLSGCARFGTTQTDIRYNEDGTVSSKVTTKASSYTLLDSKSALANWKATQGAETQNAEVGALSQEANSTNSVAVLRAIADILSNVK